MTVTVYRSTDASAPVLTGSVGTLLTVLDAVLVNGYGSKSAAGWTKPFSNSGNIGCYQNSAVDGTGFCLNVNDAAPGVAGAREARMTGFETLTALSTGTGQFPTSGQLAIGIGAVVLRKSSTADSTARVWTIVADDTVFYFFAETVDNPTFFPTTPLPFMFGDFFSFKTSDAYRCAIIGRNIENSAAVQSEGFGALHAASTTFLSQTMIGHYMPRSWTAVSGSIGFGKHIDHARMGQFGANSSLSGLSSIVNSDISLGFNFNAVPFSYPNTPDGGLFLSPVWLHHSSAVRGYLKGLWAPSHDRPLSHNATYSGTGNMSAKSFLVQSVPVFRSNTVFAGQVHLETSSTWS